MDNQTAPLFAGGELLAGKYRIERVLGEGGMGLVLAAKHEALNQNVAIKLLREEALKFNQVVGRFMREARAAVSLRSEHVARVLDVGSLEDGRPFIVMERLDGQDLGEVIESRQNIPIPEVVDWVIQACEAIAEAHAAGIVHRDLKPKNLFLTHAVHGKPLVKVLDFGISKIDTRDGSGGPADMSLTKTTEVIGSPSYMSPEQLRSSRDVDGRSDVWALGVILYELLTNRVPFYAETVTELVVVVVTEREPPVRTVRPDVPEGLAAIIARCLEKRPEHRFQNVVELVQALEPYAHGAYGQTSASDRIAAVAGFARPSTPRGSVSPPTQPSSGAAPYAPSSPSGVSSPSARVNVHGGTSVAWGATESQPVPLMLSKPPPAQKSRAGTYFVVGAIALACLGIGVGGAAYAIKKSTQGHRSGMVPATGESAMPLPQGRKDLPLVPPPPAATAPPTPAPTESALPDVRKPPAAPATPATPAAKPAPPKPVQPSGGGKAPADLDNIGRR